MEISHVLWNQGQISWCSLLALQTTLCFVWLGKCWDLRQCLFDGSMTGYLIHWGKPPLVSWRLARCLIFSIKESWSLSLIFRSMTLCEHGKSWWKLVEVVKVLFLLEFISTSHHAIFAISLLCETWFRIEIKRQHFLVPMRDCDTMT